MRKFWLLLLLLLACPPQAGAQTAVALWCNTGVGINPWAPCGSSNPLAVTTIISTGQYTPSAPTTLNAGKLGTGATAQNLFTTGEVVHGCVITNPGNATDQNIAAAEEIWVNFVTTATQAANSASIPIAVGQSIPCPGGLTTAVSWIATTINHQISAYKY